MTALKKDNPNPDPQDADPQGGNPSPDGASGADDDDDPDDDAGLPDWAVKRVRAARRDARRAQDEAKAARDELTSLKTRLDELEGKDLTELDRLKKQVPALEQQVQALEREKERLEADLREQRLIRAVDVLARDDEVRFHDSDDALAFLDRDAVVWDEDEPEAKSLKKELKRILAEKPHLAASANGAGSVVNVPSAPEPSAPITNANDDAALRKGQRDRILSRVFR